MWATKVVAFGYIPFLCQYRFLELSYCSTASSIQFNHHLFSLLLHILKPILKQKIYAYQFLFHGDFQDGFRN